jgi:hypothetical protein
MQCSRCGTDEAAYHHGSPQSGVCRRCSHEGNKADYVGQVFSGRVVMGLHRERRDNDGKLIRWWSVKCPNCERVSVCKQSHLRSTGCFNCRVRKWSPCDAAQRQVLARYRHGASGRGIRYDLTETEAVRLLMGECHYCGRSCTSEAKVKGGAFAHTGIDRIDSAIGYEIGNCVSCCWDCNRAKGGLTVDQFIAHVRRIASRLP